MIKPEYEFFMAITSINVTYFLKVYFHLADFLDIRKDKAKICPRKGFKTFCALLSKNQDLLQELHHFLFTDIFENWVYIKTKFNASILDFGVAQKHTEDSFKKIWNKRQYQNLKSFTKYFKSLHQDISEQNFNQQGRYSFIQ